MNAPDYAENRAQQADFHNDRVRRCSYCLLSVFLVPYSRSSLAGSCCIGLSLNNLKHLRGILERVLSRTLLEFGVASLEGAIALTLGS